MSTKVNRLAKERLRLDKVKEFSIHNQQLKTGTKPDPKFQIDELDFTIFKNLHANVLSAQNALQTHIQAFNGHQATLDQFLNRLADQKGIKEWQKEYVFNIDSHSFVLKSAPRSQGGQAPDPEPPKDKDVKK